MSDVPAEKVPQLQGRGGTMPALGFGTWRLNGSECVEAVSRALQMGYRHIDSAQAYQNEEEVGIGIRDSGVERREIFLTTKIPPDRLDEASLRIAVHESLDRLGTDYVDLLLMHWPNPQVPLEETLAAMAAAVEDGEVRHIGLSNFTVQLMKEAEMKSERPIFCNQVEYHPLLSEAPVLDYCREKGILLTAYCPLARGKVLREPVVEQIARKHARTPAQMVLRWLLQQDGVATIPKSASAERQRENFEIFDFEIPEAEMRAISALERGERVARAGGHAPEWDT